MEGALAWAAYAVVETLFVVPVRWLATNSLEYYPVHPALNALVLAVYPLAGAAAAAAIALITRGRLVRTAGLVALGLGLAASAALSGDFAA